MNRDDRPWVIVRGLATELKPDARDFSAFGGMLAHLDEPDAAVARSAERYVARRPGLQRAA